MTHTIELSDEELFTLYFDAGAMADGPWPWRAGNAPPCDAPTAEARDSYKAKITAVVERRLA